MKSTSFWLGSGTETRCRRLEGRICADVAIVGGGIAGLSAALCLKRAGYTVAVIERESIGRGESGHTTAHLTELVDPGHRVIAQRFGSEVVRQVRSATRAAIDRIELWSNELAPDCEFKRIPAYLYTETRAQLPMLFDEFNAFYGKHGETPPRIDVPLPFVERIVGAMRVPDQAQFHPVRYLQGLAHAILGGGCHVFENSPVTRMSEEEDCHVSTPWGEVIADAVIVASGSPIFSRVLPHIQLTQHRTYVLGVSVRKSSLPEPALYEDLDEPYHFIRSAESSSGTATLLVGGEDHRVGFGFDTETHFEALEAYVRERFAVRSVRSRWSGQILESIDGLPYIGRSPLSERTFLATGFSGSGMTYGTLSGILLADLIQGRESAWTEVFESTRGVQPSLFMRLLSRRKDFSICWLKGRLNVPESLSLDEIPYEEGRIVRIGKKNVAVYKEATGKCHTLSAVCTHMGCRVEWNSSEKSWDCPCHGSRFGFDGRVLNGPAISPLERIGEQELRKYEEEAA